MRRKNFPIEMVYQVFSLLVVFIIVHGTYVALIRPQADSFLAAEQVRMTEQPDAVQEQNFYVVIRDFEQEACLILFFWALAILAYKGVVIWRQQGQLEEDLLQLAAEHADRPRGYTGVDRSAV